MRFTVRIQGGPEKGDDTVSLACFEPDQLGPRLRTDLGLRLTLSVGTRENRAGLECVKQGDNT